jgi:hypothetical protein
MHEVLLCPTTLFPSKWHEDIRFMGAVLSKEELTLSTLRKHLETVISKDPAIPNSALALASFVHRLTLELHRGQPIPENEFLNPHEPAAKGVSLAAPATKTP